MRATTSAKLEAMEQSAFLPRRLRQDDGHWDWQWQNQAVNLAVGEQVQVMSGPLAGLRGILTTQTMDGKWVLEPDAARGILICIRDQQLRRA